jgi:hypothetical protein
MHLLHGHAEKDHENSGNAPLAAAQISPPPAAPRVPANCRRTCCLRYHWTARATSPLGMLSPCTRHVRSHPYGRGGLQVQASKNKPVIVPRQSRASPS